MPLTLVEEGTEASIVWVSGREEVRHHLGNTGFVPGAGVTIVSADNGNVIINVKKSGVAISKEMANKIMVQTGHRYEKERSINKMRTLKEIECKSAVTIVKPHGEGTIKHRIVDVGIAKGTEVYVRKVAPLGDPVEMDIGGYELLLRKADVEMIGMRQELLFFKGLN